MLRSIVLAGTLLLPLSTPAGAVTMKDFDIEDTADLVTLCTATESTQSGLYDDAVMFCHGFIVGAARYHDAVSSGPDNDPIVCAGDDVTRIDVIKVFLDWTEANPDSMSRPAVQTLVRAAAAKWPCE